MPTIGGVGCSFCGNEKEAAEPNDTTDRFARRDAVAARVVGVAPALVLRTGWAVGACPRAPDACRCVVVVPSAVGLLH
ncbi:MAG TPA: hypothetical protein VGI86_08180, partial [Acidimicrobiia bacterium]